MRIKSSMVNTGLMSILHNDISCDALVSQFARLVYLDHLNEGGTKYHHWFRKTYEWNKQPRKLLRHLQVWIHNITRKLRKQIGYHRY